ncbi:hypothetical protein ACFV06_10585 [Streptomyces sp. NPDC059618]|uniref:hypothetical protein n=1 Tax=Streptomyces sp. NPDC059618 TaxID=3346887 RepID=UPI0036B5B243
MTRYAYRVVKQQEKSPHVGWPGSGQSRICRTGLNEDDLAVGVVVACPWEEIFRREGPVAMILLSKAPAGGVVHARDLARSAAATPSPSPLLLFVIN